MVTFNFKIYNLVNFLVGVCSLILSFSYTFTCQVHTIQQPFPFQLIFTDILLLGNDYYQFICSVHTWDRKSNLGKLTIFPLYKQGSQWDEWLPIFSPKHCRNLKFFHSRLFTLKQYDLPTNHTRVLCTYSYFTRLIILDFSILDNFAC